MLPLSAPFSSAMTPHKLVAAMVGSKPTQHKDLLPDVSSHAPFGSATQSTRQETVTPQRLLTSMVQGARTQLYSSDQELPYSGADSESSPPPAHVNTAAPLIRDVHASAQSPTDIRVPLLPSLDAQQSVFSAATAANPQRVLSSLLASANVPADLYVFSHS